MCVYYFKRIEKEINFLINKLIYKIILIFNNQINLIGFYLSLLCSLIFPIFFTQIMYMIGSPNEAVMRIPPIK